MSKLKLVISDSALADIDAISAYIALDNKNAAKEFLKTVKKTVIYLSEFPKMGKRRPDLTDEDVLFFPIRWTYDIVYQIQDDTLYIVRIYSDYQDIKSFF